MLLNEVRDGTFIYPEFVDEIMYKQYKDDPVPSAMKAFIGFGCSFAGKWFGGYARRLRDDNNAYNFALAAKNSLLKKSKGLVGASFICKDYRDLKPTNKIIYCDPPYKETTKIFDRDFNTDEFWDIMRDWSKDNIVVISEYNAPSDFKTLLEIPTNTGIRDKTGKVSPRIEKLFGIG